MLYDKSRYVRRSKELFDDLGLRNAEYSHMYERKRAIERALKELAGIRLSRGMLTSATVEKTVDGKDYKVAFSKLASTAIDAEIDEKLPEPAPPGVVVNDYSKPKDPLVAQAEELVEHFHKLFYSVETHRSQSKETAQALSLITQYGMTKSRHIVEFARTVASTTNYAPQTFGGILHYTSRGAADFDRLARLSAPIAAVPKRPTEQQRQESELRARGESRLAVLTAEQHAARLEQAKAELFRQNPFMPRQPEGSKIREGALRSWLIRQLGEEPMDLVILAGQTDPEAVRRKLGLQNLHL
jgi:hypothetical protein